MAMTLRLTDEDERALAALAAAQGISKQEATVRAIRDAAARGLHEAKAVSYTHLRAHETVLDLVCRLLLEKKTQDNT